MSASGYILKSHDIDTMTGVEKTHFLNPKAQRINKSLGDATGLTGLGFHLIEVAPGAETTEHHVHYYEDECVYILEGDATAYLGDEAHAIGAGDFIGYRRGGLSHSIINTGTGVLRIIVVGQRLAHDVADYTQIRKRIFRHEGMPWTLADIDDLTEVGGSVGKK